jgi:hypothetical protein
MTHSKELELNEPAAASSDEHSFGPASENVAPLSHHDESAAETPSLPISQTGEPISQGASASEIAETPSVAALSVDNEERDDDSAIGDSSI